MRHTNGASPETRESPYLSILFVLVFSYFWIGIDPFPSASDPSLLLAYSDTSNAINQLVVLFMSFLVFAALLQHPSRRVLLRSYGPLLVILLWLLVTAVFADSPATVLRRIIYSGLVCVCASTMLLLPRNSEQFTRLIGLCTLFAVCVALVSVVVLPQRAIHQATDAIEQALAGDWRGQFGHKNAAAAAMAYAVFVGLYVMRSPFRKTGLLLTAGASIFLLNSGGKTAAAMLPAILIATWAFEKIGPIRLLAVLGGLAVMNLILMSTAVSPSIQQFLASIGVDPTFTDRTSIWELALSAAAQHPIIGYGFQSFWQTDGLFASGQSLNTWAVTAANAHNGYLDQVINGGIPLLILMLVWLVILPCRHASIAIKRNINPDLTRLFVRIWLYSLFASCLETSFFANNGPVWFTILISVFGLRLQALASPAKIPTPERRAHVGNPLSTLSSSPVHR